MRTRLVQVTALVVVALGALACGREGPLGGPQAFCAVDDRIDAVYEKRLGALAEDAPVDQVGAAVIAASQEAVSEGLVERAERLVPEELRDEIAFLATGARKAAAGDPSQIASPDAEKADDAVHEYCGTSDPD